MKILLVDDHALFRAGLRMLLSTIDTGIEPLEAATLSEAISLIELHPDLDLCLLDLSLRDEFGLRALAKIRLVAPSVPVVVVSGNDEPGVIRDCIDGGAMGFIPKGIETNLFLRALKMVLAGEAFLPQGLFADDSDEPRRPVLTPRQREVLRCLARGLPTKLIARELGLSEHTVKGHIKLLFQILGVNNRTEAVIKSSRLRPSSGG